MRGTASLVSPFELPAAKVQVTRSGGPGPPLRLVARLGIRVQPERSSETCILWAVERLDPLLLLRPAEPTGTKTDEASAHSRAEVR